MENKKCEEKVDFGDWFDIYNIEHVRAYRHLQNNGVWPKGFKPAYVTMQMNWEPTLKQLMVDAYIDGFISVDDFVRDYDDDYDGMKEYEN